MVRSARAGAALACAASLLGLGCAGIGGAWGRVGGAEPSGPDPEIRAASPPEYDVLVAQLHEIDGRVEEALEAYRRAVAKDENSAYLHRKLAQALARTNHLDEALDHAERAFALDPDDTSVRLFLAQIYRLRRDTARAQAVLLGADGEPIDESSGLLLYKIYMEAGELEQALEIAQWLIASDPTSLRAHLAAAKAYQGMEEPVLAEQALRSALELDPENLQIYAEIARSRRARDDRAGEIEIYREILEQHPGHRGSLVALGEAQYALEDLEAAIATFEAIEANYPDDLTSVVRLGFLLYEAGDFEGAAERFERILEVSPDEHQIAFFLGVTRRRLGEEEQAIAAFRRIPPEHEHYVDARTQLAAILERRGDYQGALEEIRRASEVEARRSLDLYRATLLAKTGRFDEAVAYLEGMLADHPEDDELLYNLGVVYGEADHPDRAIDYMERALEKNPDNASALNYIGYTWAEKGENLDRAEELIRRAVELRPDDGYIADSLGWVYYMRARPLVESGRRTEARPLIERALEELYRAHELTGGDPVISEHLGDTYLLLDDKEEALDRFEEALRLDPREGEQPNLFDKLESLRRELR